MSQLLWIGSKKMGVGVSKSPDNSYNIVVNYDPSGNVKQYFKENLPNITQENIDEGEKIVKQLKDKNNEWQVEWTSESSPEATYYSHSMPSSYTYSSMPSSYSYSSMPSYSHNIPLYSSSY